MGKGRAPCCDKSRVKRGPWSPAEDLTLITFIQKNGHENWRALPKQAGLLRCGKSCRLRWINYLRPDVKRGNFTKEEEDTIIELHQTLGNKWSKIASHLPGRTDNEIKNVWNTHLKKREASRDAYLNRDESKESSITSSPSSSSSTIVSYEKTNRGTGVGHQWNQGRVTKKPRILEDFQVFQGMSRELSPISESRGLSSSSNSSNNSNVTNCSQGGASRMEDQTGPMLGSSYHTHEVQNSLEEVNKRETDENGLEIPLEADFDFWNMLDSLSFFQTNTDATNKEVSNLGGEYNGEIENKMWLRFLENELGLEATKDANQEDLSNESAQHHLISETYQYEIPSKPEVRPGLGSHHLWPSA